MTLAGLTGQKLAGLCDLDAFGERFVRFDGHR